MIKEQLIAELQAVEEPRELDIRVTMGSVTGVITRCAPDQDGQAVLSAEALPPPSGDHDSIDARST